jgi:hypothetical protein
LLSLREANIGLPTCALDVACLTCPQTDIAPRHTITKPAACSLPRTCDAVRTPGAAGGGAASEVEARGATLRYLPEYSPDLNPIETPFSKVKADLRQGCRADNSAPPPPIGQFATTPVPVPERPSVLHSSLYLPEPVYEVRRKIAFDERLHALVLEGIDAALRRREYPSVV